MRWPAKDPGTRCRGLEDVMACKRPWNRVQGAGGCDGLAETPKQDAGGWRVGKGAYMVVVPPTQHSKVIEVLIIGHSWCVCVHGLCVHHIQ